MSNEDTKTLIALTKDKNALLWKINQNLKIIVVAINIVFWGGAALVLVRNFL